MATRWGICSAGKISHDFTVALRTLAPENHKVNVVYIGTIHPYHLATGKLFMKSKKNVLIEKPLAMNLREVQELISTAQDNSVFLMEVTNSLMTKITFAIDLQSGHVSVTVEVRRLLEQGEVGDVQMVRADLGAPLTHIPRLAERKLGGGALLDLGIYCLQFIFTVFNGERPESIQATGHCIDTGVDGTAVLVLKFSGNRLAICTCSITMMLTCDAVITGTKGTIKIPDHMWCPTSLEVNGKDMQFPLPEASMPLNFTNSTGLRYEAEEVRQCLLKGLKESPGMPWAHSSLIAEVLDEARRQLGVTYDQDNIQ
ncbi:hypothetical protein F7725_001864 [Dissostichus mawsoni]|uniref:Trans-1,2-dihydrobenzene-1,2-diol dehydrogenase n=1 Tax=Dissostichus mawsoni TaxID=36200 RepID=A0A7J5Y0T7_DISMA|nr:hypothetical protein F7725_001864 [Dissostichus mawsoni]